MARKEKEIPSLELPKKSKSVPACTFAPIAHPPQTVGRSKHSKKVKVPKLILSGEWLKAIGFPIGAPLHLASDRRGEIVLHRLGLKLPRTLRIMAKCQRPGALRQTASDAARRDRRKDR